MFLYLHTSKNTFFMAVDLILIVKGIGLQRLCFTSEDGMLERLTSCNKFYENPLINKKVIEV